MIAYLAARIMMSSKVVKVPILYLETMVMIISEVLMAMICLLGATVTIA
jgi:hypothetical protein